MPGIPRVGSPGKAAAELTCFRWVTISPGNGIDLNSLMLSRTSIDDYEKLCSLDVLGVQDIPKTHEDRVNNNRAYVETR